MIKRWMAAALLAILAGCGGGEGYEDPPTSSTQPVHCNASPDACQ